LPPQLLTIFEIYQRWKTSLSKVSPEIIFHLAAQPLVSSAYLAPVDTFQVNLLGTVNLLEAARSLKDLKSIVVVSTDKCYENKEWVWPYRESDRLGGSEPYAASKACVEIATKAYSETYFKDSNIAVATARAGNVIGGGDWSDDRLHTRHLSGSSSKQKVEN
jgi:CDP-glucose 4,6-dehydratase